MARPFTLTAQKLDSTDTPYGNTYTFDHISVFTFDNPSQIWNLIRIPRSNGSVRQRMGKQNRKLRIEGYAEGTNLSTMQAKVKILEDFFDSDYGLKITRITSGGLTKYFKGVLTEPISFRVVLFTVFFTINILCTDISEA